MVGQLSLFLRNDFNILLAGGHPSGDKTMDFRFPDFPDQESGKPDFQHVHVNQLSKSFKMSGHMVFSGFPVSPVFWI